MKKQSGAKKEKNAFERFKDMVNVFSPLSECLECFSPDEISEIEAQSGLEIAEAYKSCLQAARLNFRKMIMSAALEGNVSALKQVKIQMELCRAK